MFQGLRRPSSCPVPSKPFRPPPSRSIRAEEGARKEFRSRVAGDPLESLDSLSNMEGIGSYFRCFSSFLTRPGRFHDASLKTLGARLEANQGSTGEALVGAAARRVGSRPGNGAATHWNRTKRAREWRRPWHVQDLSGGRRDSRLRARISAIALEPSRAMVLSARLVSMIGTRAPSTIPAISASAR